MTLRRYTSSDEDSARWAAIDLRDDDIVVSTRSKHGTTWVQAILLMLVHGPELPDTLAELSPWVDHLVEPVDELAARLDAQHHRRVLKSHTPLDGLPHRPGVHRVVVARNPLDAAVSLYHQGLNFDRQRMAELSGQPVKTSTLPDLESWLGDWVHAQRDGTKHLDSLQGVVHHLAGAWQRRHDPDVTLVHYSDLQADHRGQVERLAGTVGIDVDDADIDAIVAATDFAAMRRRADDFVPDRMRVLRDPDAFFRRGRPGDGTELLTRSDLADYHARMAALVDPELLAWLHR